MRTLLWFFAGVVVGGFVVFFRVPWYFSAAIGAVFGTLIALTDN